MADKYVVPPVDDDAESLRIFYEQICEQLNGSAGVLESTGLSGVDGGDIPQVTGLTAVGGYGSVYLLWDTVDYDSHSEVVFFRSEDGNYDNAISVGSTAANTFTDVFHDPKAVQTYTYWAANRNIGGNLGPISAPASTQLSVNVEYAIDVLLGKLGYDQFQDGNFPIRTEETLPLLPDGDYPEGSLIFLMSSGKLYRNVGQVWTSEIPLSDVTDAGLLAGMDDITLGYVTDAGSLAGLNKVDSTTITDGAITTPKLFTGAVVADKLASNSVITSKINAGAVTANELSANSIVAGKIASGALVVDDGVMQNGYIKTALIGDAEVTNAKMVSLDADKINTGTIEVAIKLTAAEIEGGVINGGTITGSTIQTSSTVGNTTSGGGIKLSGETLIVTDDSGSTRVKLGNLS